MNKSYFTDRAWGMWAAILLVLSVGSASAQRDPPSSPQDFADCQESADLARSIASCRRIAADPAQSAADRASALRWLGNDYIASGALDQGIAVYGEAIGLDPQNAVTYASRAIANFQKGYRAAAIADYRQAVVIDSARINGMIAGSVELRDVALAAAEAPGPVVEIAPTGLASRTGPAPSFAAPQTVTSPVAQRAVLYEESSIDPHGKSYIGSVAWRTEKVSPGQGLAPEIAVRADVEIPERHISMTLSLRRNIDPALPASHTIDVQFKWLADFPGGGVANVPGILMKSSEEVRGTPLAGLGVKVTDGFFLIGLSNVNADEQRNVQLLKERQWFDIPLVYANGGKAILAIEKGTTGDRAFVDAFAAWNESPAQAKR